MDTGATKVSLTKKDAKKLRIDLKKLKYSSKIQTANGIGFVAPVTLHSVQIGNIIVRDVEGCVGDVGPISVLGMSFLNRLDKYEIKRSRGVTFWR